MNHVRIIFAPQFEPFQPYLSLPYLKGLLNLYDIQSSYIDCNVNFYNWLFEQKEILLPKGIKQNYYLLNNIDSAVSSIKEGADDLFKYRWAINVIEEYLQAISTTNLSVSLSNLEIKNKYDTKTVKEFVFDENNLIHKYFNNHVDKIINKSNDFYFFSLAVIEQLPASLIFAKEIKKRQTNSKIAFGGPFIARFYHKLQNEEWINQIVNYIEPEEGYKSIAKIFDIKQLYTGHVTPDFSEIDNDQYLSPITVYPYLIAHGCKWGKCVFCSHHLSYKNYRCSSLLDVTKDIKSIKKKFGVEYFSFCDEYLTTEQLNELSSLLEGKQLNIKWSTFVKGESEFTDVSFMKKLYLNGCRLLFFGFETFDQRLLNSMKKGTNANNYLPILKACKKSNIAVRIDMMFGFPTESNAQAQKSFDTVVKNKDLFDTPFSSIALALFELKEDTPVYLNSEKYSIQIINSCRGNLDEIYNFTPKMEKSSIWREKLMRFFKQETDSELIAPYNKTHQLILKDLYDKGKIDKPLILSKDNMYQFSFTIHPSVDFLADSSNVILTNYTNGSEIAVPEQLGKVIGKSKNEIMSISVFQKRVFPILSDANTIYEMLNFLYRNDYIILHKNESYG